MQRALAFLTFFAILSCDKAETIHLSNNIIDYDLKSVKLIGGSASSVPVGPGTEVEVASQTSLNVAVPSNYTEQQLFEFISQNLNSISGQIVMYLDGQAIYTITIANGVATYSHNEPPLPFGGKYPCTYEGIRKCVVDAIDDMGIVSKIACSFSFYPCIAPIAADCALEACTENQPVPITVIPGNPPANSGTPSNPNESIPYTGIQNYLYGNSLNNLQGAINGHYSAPTTIIYFQSGIHYSNSAKTCILPNGYYSTIDVGLTRPVYRIENGVLVETINHTFCSTCPSAATTVSPSIFSNCGGATPNPGN